MPRSLLLPRLGCVALLFATSVGSIGCSTEAAGSTSGGAAAGPVGDCSPTVVSTNETCSSATDPLGGTFTIDQALSTLPAGAGPLQATIDTDLGAITCTLRPDKAPNGVASFVGLARGQRPWKDPKSGSWVKRPFYDGLLFHRVIPAFMAQGGDPLGTGTGGPGYTLEDEITDLDHVAGAIAYANAGPDTAGSQFYITEEAQPDLDGSYTVFGVCTPVSVVTALTHVNRDGATDRPVKDLHMKTVTVSRSAP